MIAIKMNLQFIKSMIIMNCRSIAHKETTDSMTKSSVFA